MNNNKMNWPFILVIIANIAIIVVLSLALGGNEHFRMLVPQAPEISRRQSIYGLLLAVAVGVTGTICWQWLGKRQINGLNAVLNGIYLALIWVLVLAISSRLRR